MGAAQAEQLGPVATRTLFENDDVRVWEMDLQPGEVCGLHHHTLDYVLFILSSASVGALRRGENPPGGKPRGFPLHARATYFVPAGGIESAHNVGTTRFHEALFELKRPAKRGAERLGFVGCEAVAGREPEPGTITILDNDRVARERNHARARRGERDAPLLARRGRLRRRGRRARSRRAHRRRRRDHTPHRDASRKRRVVSARRGAQIPQLRRAPHPAGPG